jgi:hypothetical protein
VNVFPIMHKVGKFAKGNLSTRLSYEEKETCRTLSYIKKFGQASIKVDKLVYQFMSNNFFALAVVTLATSSNDMPLISAICSATSLTYPGSLRFPR